MVLDVRKERLIEEFVQDLLVDLEESKRSITTLRKQHEREILEITGEWTRDYRKLVREVQQLRLALQARLVEQEISNDMEQSLHDRLNTLQRRADSMQAQLEVERSAYTSIENVTDDYSDDETLSGDPEMVTDMSSSTCVSLPDRNGKFSPSPRRRTVSESQRRPSMLRIPLRPVKRQTPHVSPSVKSPDRKLNTGAYAGFSFNPLFFGPPESIPPQRTRT
ncbi:hypothetical protein BDQ17DRAFT_1240546 [Cyathus striatus]|nr:hypothetical protein BDQ17DRAFT_1240546 [Cyathus striatus]